MGTAAEVGKRTLLVEGYGATLRQVIDEFHLILFIILRHKFYRLFAGKFEAGYGSIGLDDLCHFGFDFCKVILSYGRLEVKIVVEAVFYNGPYGELAGGENGLYRLSKDVRAGMAVNFKPLLVLQRYDF